MITGLKQTRRLQAPRLATPHPNLGNSRRSRAMANPAPAQANSPRLPVEPYDSGSAPAESSRGDALQLYLREIGQVKLLTPDDEVALAKRIQHGDNVAREQMIKANLRLVVKIARDYEGLGLPCWISSTKATSA